MVHRRSYGMGALCGLSIALASIGAVAAEADQLLATVERPAVVTATPAPLTEAKAGQSTRVVIKVMGFEPAQDGPVQAVVKAERNGTEQEIGRFAITPYTKFRAAEPAKAKRFALPLPKELASGDPVKFNVYLVPAQGGGKGASMEIGGAEIR
jgi:hypothetical protein